MTIRTYIIPADIRDELHGKLDIDGLRGMFQQPLYADGSESPTHYISSGIVDDDLAAIIEAQLPASLKGEDVAAKEGEPAKDVADIKALRTDTPPLTFAKEYGLAITVDDAAAVTKTSETKAK